MPEIVSVGQGRSPLVLSMPHCGLALSPEVAPQLNETGIALGDTDWWIDTLYSFADAFDPTIVRANYSRVVIDLNRDPSGVSLYPGQATTGLCPTETFDGQPIYRPGREPDQAEIARRVRVYFEPYHRALERAAAAAVAAHGYCLLYDCHSIRSKVPRLFDGTLPVLNIGTNDGRSCAAPIRAAADTVARGSGFTHVLDGRFKGGWITRRYGRPDARVHAIQMEIAQSAYLQEETAPWMFDAPKARPLQETLSSLIAALLEAAGQHALYGTVGGAGVPPGSEWSKGRPIRP
jgi:N-formylglutamate deformylase